MKIIAMSFNLRVFTWKDLFHAWPFRKASAAAAIQAHKPWIVGTQEGLIGMLRDLEKRLPDYGWVGYGRQGGYNDEHNAIFYDKSKLQLLDWGQFWLSPTPDQAGSVGWDGRFPRICTWARFRVSGEQDRELRVYNTHLDHRGRSAQREGALLIWKTIRQHHIDFGYSPVLLLGDFNTAPEHPVIRFLSGESSMNGQKAELTHAFADPRLAGLTFHGYRGGESGSAIDYMFAGFGLKPLQASVDRSRFRGRYPSDHYPIIGAFEI